MGPPLEFRSPKMTDFMKCPFWFPHVRLTWSDFRKESRFDVSLWDSTQGNSICFSIKACLAESPFISVVWWEWLMKCGVPVKFMIVRRYCRSSSWLLMRRHQRSRGQLLINLWMLVGKTGYRKPKSNILWITKQQSEAKSYKAETLIDLSYEKQEGEIQE